MASIVFERIVKNRGRPSNPSGFKSVFYLNFVFKYKFGFCEQYIYKIPKII